jgi:hypothetical protein
MNRVVFQISALGDEHVPLVSLAEPNDPKAYHELFACPPVTRAAPEPDAKPETETDLGGRLFEALSKNKVLADHLAGARTSTESRFGVYAELLPQSRTDDFAWETLRFPDADGQQFLALSTKYAFARLVTACQPVVPVYRIAPPLRVAAVLSCLKVHAEHELAELRAAARTPDGQVRMSLLVVVSEKALAERLDKERKAGTAPEIADVKIVPSDPDALRLLVREFRPHVLHVFCHGVQGKLQIAHSGDWDREDPGPGLVLDQDGIGDLTRHSDGGFWLVVLNCCASAATDDDSTGLTSLARDLVSKGTSHAVIGMRTPIRAELAKSVTRSLYGSLLEELAARADRPGTTRPLDWAVVVAAARRRLYSLPALDVVAGAGQQREWTVPALYLRKHGFRLQVLGPGVAEDDSRVLRLELTALMSVLASLPPGAPEPFLDAVAGRIAEIAPHLGLRPTDLEGTP